MSLSRRLAVLTLLLASILTLAAPSILAQNRPYEGVTLTVITQSGPYIAKPVEMFAPEWEARTGGKINLVTVPFGDLYQKIMASFTLGTGDYDIVIFASSWMGDFAGNGYLRDITQWVLNDQNLRFDEVLSAYQDTVKWAGKIYALPLDGDVHTLYYRKDALENPEYRARFRARYGYELGVPRTWKEYRDVAEFFHGWDWDNDGQVEYGAIEAMKRGGQAFWYYLSRAAAYVSHPQRKGNLFFNPENMNPQINNPGFLRALEEWIEIKNFGPPGMINFDSGDVRSQFAAGEAALAIDWGDTGIIAATSEASVIKGKVGTAILPGSYEVYDYVTGEWTQFAEVQHSPFLAFGGWVGGIAASSPHAEAAYDFLAFLGSPEASYIATTTDATGFNPYRRRHFEDKSRWYEFGFIEPDLSLYLGAIRQSLEHPNAQLDLKLPGQARYMDAAEVELSRALAGEISPQQALNNIAAQWDRITNELGRETQLRLYREYLGL